MKKLILLALVGGLSAAFAAKPPPPLVLADYDWRDGVKDIALEGRGFPQAAAPYTRLPEEFKDRVTEKVWSLSKTAIGFNARFVTDSKAVAVRWTVRAKLNVMPTFTYAMIAGVDIYRRSGKGAWEHVAVGAPDWETGKGELRVSWKPGDECMIYLPVRAYVHELAVGVEKGKSWQAPPPHAYGKPVVIYGTSIVNGGCASRPGLIFPAIMGRRLDAEVIDLGFSGAGKMELPMADIVAKIDAALYVIDCDWNMSIQVQKANYEPFVRRFKELRPDVPVLLCGGCTEKSVPRDCEIYSRGIFEKLRKEDEAKWGNWHYLSGVDALPDDSDCTGDHCHPNDYGFMQMGRVYAETIRGILGK